MVERHRRHERAEPDPLGDRGERRPGCSSTRTRARRPGSPSSVFGIRWSGVPEPVPALRVGRTGVSSDLVPGSFARWPDGELHRGDRTLPARWPTTTCGRRTPTGGSTGSPTVPTRSTRSRSCRSPRGSSQGATGARRRLRRRPDQPARSQPRRGRRRRRSDVEPDPGRGRARRRSALPPLGRRHSCRSPTRAFDAWWRASCSSTSATSTTRSPRWRACSTPGGRFCFFLNHPLLQTPNSGWIDDQILDPPEQYWRIGPYLVEDETIEEVEKDVFIPFIHRPLSRYVNALVRRRSRARADGGTGAAARLPRQGRRVRGRRHHPAPALPPPPQA